MGEAAPSPRKKLCRIAHIKGYAERYHAPAAISKLRIFRISIFGFSRRNGSQQGLRPSMPPLYLMKSDFRNFVHEDTPTPTCEMPVPGGKFSPAGLSRK